MTETRWKMQCSSVNYDSQVLNILNAIFLNLIITETPTHNTNNILDKILVLDCFRVNILLVDPASKTIDHDLIVFEIAAPHIRELFEKSLNFNSTSTTCAFLSSSAATGNSSFFPIILLGFWTYFSLEFIKVSALEKKRSEFVLLLYCYTSQTVPC